MLYIYPKVWDGKKGGIRDVDQWKRERSEDDPDASLE